MTNKINYLRLLSLPAFAIAAYIVHKLVIEFIVPNVCNVTYFPENVYAFFFVCSVMIVLSLKKIKSINIDYVGYAFLLLTCIKMAGAYAFFNMVFDDGGTPEGNCKINFFIVFLLFLAAETYAAIKLLNRK